MAKTITTKYDVFEHLRTPQEMAAYLEMCIEEANGDTAFITKALGNIARAKGMTQVARGTLGCLVKVCIRLSPGKEVQGSIPFLKS